MYFKPMLHDGEACRDGGLRENNPIQVAVDEARTIWGKETVFDMILSLGCGKANKPQKEPANVPLPEWLKALFATLLATMNGDEAWKFHKNMGHLILDRCTRLNIVFPNTIEHEPALDDVGMIPEMECLATITHFPHKYPLLADFAPVAGYVDWDMLGVLAARHKAALYFFELKSISQHDDVSIITGWICCCVDPGAPLERLIGATSFFQIKGQEAVVPPLREKERFKMEVSFQQQASRDTEAIRIDVKFDTYSFLATISGFPMALKVSSSVRKE
jgi:hypothetical protein